MTNRKLKTIEILTTGDVTWADDKGQERRDKLRKGYHLHDVEVKPCPEAGEDHFEIRIGKQSIILHQSVFRLVPL